MSTRGRRNTKNSVEFFEEEEESEYEYEEEEEEDTEDIEPEYYQSSIYPTDFEKSSALNMMNELRADGVLCDVTFTIKDYLFPAHQVVVCGNSRWLRSLLIGGEENVINMDIFSKDIFKQVLAYMYGQSVNIAFSDAEEFIKIARRLELGELEQKVWEFLLSIVDSDNCSEMHELADKYDHPHMKLVAWQVLQQAVPGYAYSPANILELRESMVGDQRKGLSSKSTESGTSLRSAPGGKRGSLQRYMTRRGSDLVQGDDDDDDDENIPSIFAGHENMEDYIPPDELDPDANAEEVVRSWATRLQIVWKECQPDLDELETSAFPSRNRRGPKRNFSKKEKDMLHERKRVFVDYRQEMTDFYAEHNPQKLEEVDTILKAFEDHDDMLEKLYDQYEVPMPRELKANIELSKKQKELLLAETEEQKRRPVGDGGGGRGGGRSAPSYRGTGGSRGPSHQRSRQTLEESEEEYEEEEYEEEEEEEEEEEDVSTFYYDEEETVYEPPQARRREAPPSPRSAPSTGTSSFQGNSSMPSRGGNQMSPHNPGPPPFSSTSPVSSGGYHGPQASRTAPFSSRTGSRNNMGGQGIPYSSRSPPSGRK
jgi:hypothetical protein